MRRVPGIDRLVVRPRPKEGESCTGYLIRVTEANAYPNLAFLTGHADCNIGGFTKVGKEHEARQQWRALEAALEMPKGEIQRRWPRQVYTSDRWRPAPLGSLPLVQADHASGISQVCPECLAEDGYCQTLWELRYYTVCHRHHRLMVSHCGACGDPLSAKRRALQRCGSCDAELNAACPPTRPETVAWVISDVLAKGVEGARAPIAQYDSIDFPWRLVEDAFALVDAVRMMGWLTEMQIKKWLAANQSAALRQSQIVRTMTMFADWPNNWLGKLQQDINERARVKSKLRMRLFYHERHLLAKGSDRVQFMQRAFADWLSEQHPEIWTTRAFRPLASSWQRGEELMTVTDAAQLLGCSGARIRWMAKKGLLTAAPDVIGGIRSLVTKESVETARQMERGSLNWKQALAILKCDYHLISDEWFRGLMEPEQYSKCGRLHIRKERIQWLFDQISNARVPRVQRAEVVRMRQAVSIVSKAGGSYAWILRQILEGNLPVAGFHRGRGIKRMSFYRRDVEALKMILSGRCALDTAILREADRKVRAWS